MAEQPSIDRRLRCWFPARAIKDKELTQGPLLRYLLAICSYADHRTGVTFVSLSRLGEDLEMSERQVRRSLTKLEKMGYLRRLVSQHPPVKGNPPTRRQVLFTGADDPVPSEEEIRELEAPEIQRGGPGVDLQRSARRLAQRYVALVQQNCGVPADWQGQIDTATDVLRAGHSVDDVVAVVVAYLGGRKRPPPGLAACLDALKT